MREPQIKTDEQITGDCRHIRELVSDPQNRRRHNPRNIGMIVDALHQVGAARSIVIDEDNVILAGNGVTEGAAEAGIYKLRIIDASGDELIAVRRTGLSPEQKRALAIFDNRTAELASWSEDQLKADHEAGLDFEPYFTDAELDAAMGGGLPAEEEPKVDTPGGGSSPDKLTFRVTEHQAGIIRAALAHARDGESSDSADGTALAGICQLYLTDNGCT